MKKMQSYFLSSGPMIPANSPRLPGVSAAESGVRNFSVPGGLSGPIICPGANEQHIALEEEAIPHSAQLQ
jgi:hypothetical protein